ncbi:MAG: MFS transporter [Candidatus Korarchaeota archaeon]|nr:MFS transporter [Candidatus Korarchaeota archaeon]NIW15273.1 MFS transporter [Candidatus Thorarchaeota archaeon]
MPPLHDDPVQVEKILSISLLVIVISHTLIHVAGSIRTSIYPLIKEEFTLTNKQIGIIAAIPPLCQALFTLPAGVLSDKLTSRKIIAFSIGMAVTGALLAGITLNVFMFIVATSLLTLSSTFFHPPANSYLSKDTTPQNRPKALGVFNSGGILGFALGSFSITILMGWWGYQWRDLYQFWIIPPLLILGGLYFVPTYPTGYSNSSEANLEETEEEGTLLSSNMIFFLLASGIRRFGGSMTTAFLSIYLVERRTWTIGLVGLMFGVSRVIGLIAASLGGALASHFGEKEWTISSLFPAYVCFLAAFLVSGVVPFLALYLMYRFFGMLGMPALSAITARLSPREKRGRGYALSFLPGSIVGTIGPIVAGFIADAFGIFPIFILSGVIFCVGLVVLELGVNIK